MKIILLKKSLIKQFLRYILIGLTAAVIEYISFSLLLFISNSKILSNSISMLLGAVFSFIFNRINFNTNKYIIKQIFRYLTLFIFNILLSNILLVYLSEIFIFINPRYIKLFLIPVIALWNFLICKYFIF